MKFVYLHIMFIYIEPSNISITVDCCHPLFITSEQVIISLRNGDM